MYPMYISRVNKNDFGFFCLISVFEFCVGTASAYCVIPATPKRDAASTCFFFTSMTIQTQSLSSAADSPTSSTSSSRKRQRSTSQSSAAEEESLKRGSPRPQIDSLSINDPVNMGQDSEMDIYMKEQDHSEQLSATEKLSRVAQLKRSPMALNQTWFLVDRTWCRRWRAALGEIDPKSHPEPISESDLGPPSTSALLDQYGNLKPGLAEEVDFEFIPEEAWKLLVAW